MSFLIEYYVNMLKGVTTIMNDYFLLQNFVNETFKTSDTIDHETISIEFLEMLQKEFDDERFEQLLIFSGYIPDIYPNDSSEEVLFTKLVEALVYEWSIRMGYGAELIKQKSSVEDIKITINDKVIVCDAKSYRLGRSQQAPNAKDFLKLEDIRKWMERYEHAIGGLVTYPCTHEWKNSSDIYQYCSTKDAPTVMLPYKYLAFLLNSKDKFTSSDFIKLWDYENIFPDKLYKSMKNGNKQAYWSKINQNIIIIANSTSEDFEKYMDDADKIINSCINENLKLLNKIKSSSIEKIKYEVNEIDDLAILKKLVIDYKTEVETDLLDKQISRIKSFRL